ncbi:hypothetical protein [Spartinivicinus poritis]|uniref:Immunity protein 35 domain-containing protein n=1 Tax=Spartinivicinus poritis TaxID=2994640 RepID=A0ABT5UH08_9GAMM|nr:hypothetical protein [Spartinivicinus sp. A2-2]MDE1465495.1 hypothetical protein [Spartinivicinus sp. A2-2]
MSNITFEHAQMLAWNLVKNSLGTCTGSLLKKHFREEEFGWIFYPNQELNFPDNSILKNELIVVTKKGTVRTIVDLSDNTKKMDQYIIQLKKYIDLNGE